MENEKLFELMEKIYGELLSLKKETTQKLTTLEKDQKDTNSRLTKIETKVEQLDDYLKQLAEIQLNHFEQNTRTHQEIVEMLCEKVSTVEKLVKNSNIKIVK